MAERQRVASVVQRTSAVDQAAPAVGLAGAEKAGKISLGITILLDLAATGVAIEGIYAAAADWEAFEKEHGRLQTLWAQCVVLGTDTLSGPNKWTKTRIATRRGEYWAVISTSSGDLRLPSQPSEERAEEDRKTWMRWAKSPRGTLSIAAPTANRYRFLVWGGTALLLAATLSTAYVNLRPRAPSQAPKRRGRL